MECGGSGERGLLAVKRADLVAKPGPGSATVPHQLTGVRTAKAPHLRTGSATFTNGVPVSKSNNTLPSSLT